MKATDLMLGDYVKVKPSGMIIKVAAIHQKKVGYHSCQSKLEWVRRDLIEPIPLTPEILEKNGFESIITVFNGLTYQYASKNEECRVRVFINDKNIATGIEIDSKVCWLNCDCSFVHELQHALRLCDVGKEIVL
jgi:hypothetical protein